MESTALDLSCERSHIAGNARLAQSRGIEVFGESFDYTIGEKKIAVNKAKRIILENARGNARINGSDATEVRVVGRKTVRSLSRERADEPNRLAELELIEQAMPGQPDRIVRLRMEGDSAKLTIKGRSVLARPSTNTRFQAPTASFSSRI